MTEPGLTGPLPEPVRTRAIRLAAEALDKVPAEHLPAALKRVATFAPARRAKLAGLQIASVLETDPEFREHLATQVRSLVPALAEALDAQSVPAAADPVELAAAAFLLRPQGWQSVLAHAVETVSAERSRLASREEDSRIERLRRQLGESTEEARLLRERSRRQLGELKSENADLRRKLSEARARARDAESAAAASRESSDEASNTAAAMVSASEAETRRLLRRVEELERELAAVRRAGRVERDQGTMRARLLLDTVLESAQGLRRELALPAVQGEPADAVEADVAEAASRTPSGHGSLAVDDPALLDEILNLPRAHMIVDGYNVTKSAWPDSSLEIQRNRLLSGLAALVARSRAEITVVFDAAEKSERPLVNGPRGVRVLFSPLGVIADDVIRQLIDAEPPGRPVVVVSSDREVVRDVLRSGARAVASTALERLLARP